MPDRVEIRDAQRATWGSLSSGWDKWNAVIMDQMRPVGDAMVEALAIAPDQRHLDIACGTGEPGLTVARLAPQGHVVLTDLSAEMLDVAARTATAQGITNVDTRVCSADDLPFDDESFDSVSVRFGYMFFPDLAAATAEFVRVLRPGSRVCAAVWIKPDENPWTSIVLSAIGSEVPLPAVEPDAPGMFRCAAPGVISALYSAAGLCDVSEWDVSVEFVTDSAEEYWQAMSEHVSPVVTALRRVDEAAREGIAARVIAQAAAYEREGKVRVPGKARCVVGTKLGARR